MLDHLDFSFNKFLGKVSQEGVLKNSNAIVFMGNIDISGSWVSLSPCSTRNHNRLLHFKRVFIHLVVVIAIIVW